MCALECTLTTFAFGFKCYWNLSSHILSKTFKTFSEYFILKFLLTTKELKNKSWWLSLFVQIKKVHLNNALNVIEGPCQEELFNVECYNAKILIIFVTQPFTVQGWAVYVGVLFRRVQPYCPTHQTWPKFPIKVLFITEHTRRTWVKNYRILS